MVFYVSRAICSNVTVVFYIVMSLFYMRLGACFNLMMEFHVSNPQISTAWLSRVPSHAPSVEKTDVEHEIDSVIEHH